MDMAYSSSVTPRLLSVLFFGENTISFESCMAQLFIEHIFGGSEVFLLLVMAYDRYVAICSSLRYLVIMRQRVCVVLLVVSWVGGFLHSVIQLGTIYGLPFCGPNVIDHFTCDMYPLLELVCTDTYVIDILVVVNGGLMCSIVFLLLLISYGVILRSLRNLSQEGRWKALQTCGSHITVVVFFFVPCIFIYVRPAKTFSLDKSLTVFYTIVTPLLNPLIYSLRNSEMTNAMKKLWRKKSRSSIKPRVCVVLLVVSWVGGFLHSTIQVSTIYGLPFCGPNVIDHFTCDMYPLLELVCTDTYVIGILVVANGGLMCSIVFLLLLISYGVILRSLKNISQEGRQKALQTCASHITVVVFFFVPCIFMYARPVKTFPIDRSLSVFYAVITPRLNPLIYSLRNSEMTSAMKKLWRTKSRSRMK
ncbi:olfactory receptor 4A47 [Camelus ferus]|nr:olfactory receptor 4A47 [Camelus ferus]